jgi:DNA polymerase-3 subunit delta
VSAHSFRELNSRVKKGSVDKVYLLSGPDRDRRDQAIAGIEAALRTVAGGSLSVIRIRVDEAPPEDIAAHLLNVSLFETAKLIVIPDVEVAGKAAREIILDFVRTPPEGVCLLMCTELMAREISRKGPAFLQKLQKGVTHVDFSPPREAELRERARDVARKLGIRLEEGALDRILAATGNDFNLVRSELEKLSLYLPPGAAAGREEVEAVATRGGEVDVWELADAISRKDMGRAQRTLRELIFAGEKPVQIIGALWYNTVRLAWCREMLDSGMEEAEIGGKLNLRGWLLKKHLTRSMGATREEYWLILDRLSDLDVALRSRGGDVEPLFSRGVAEMVMGLRRRPAG